MIPGCSQVMQRMDVDRATSLQAYYPRINRSISNADNVGYPTDAAY